MEPFFLRCETCRARLRVRDERFLGQVQSCPKCGSMVHIVVPAGWLATGEPATPEVVEVAAVASPTLLAKAIGSVREHAGLWTAVASTVLVAGSVLSVLALQTGEDVAPLPNSSPAAGVASTEPASKRAEVPQDEMPSIDDVRVKEVQLNTDSRPTAQPELMAAPAAAALLPIEPIMAEQKPDQPSTTTMEHNSAEPPATRTLVLDAVQPEPKALARGEASLEPPVSYPPAVDVPLNHDQATPSALERPARVTNVVDQLSVSIESIELPSMPIGDFVNLISEMSAVPIRLDPRVLGDVGLSTQTKVVVQSGDITLGKLLARVLKEHQLTCVERDGELVVVRVKRD